MHDVNRKCLFETPVLFLKATTANCFWDKNVMIRATVGNSSAVVLADLDLFLSSADQLCVRQAIFSASMAGLFSWNSRWIVHRETLDHRPTICRQLTSVVGRSTFWNLYFLNVAKHTLTDDRKSTWGRLIYRAILTKRLKGDRLNTDYIKHLPPMGRWAGARRTTPCIRLFLSANWRNAHVVTD